MNELQQEKARLMNEIKNIQKKHPDVSISVIMHQSGTKESYYRALMKRRSNADIEDFNNLIQRLRDCTDDITRIKNKRKQIAKIMYENKIAKAHISEGLEKYKMFCSITLRSYNEENIDMILDYLESEEFLETNTDKLKRLEVKEMY